MTRKDMMQTRWDCFYGSEQELIEDMLKAKSDVKTCRHWELVKGYVYIESFKKYYATHGCLTEKQMTQLKRLGSTIYKHVHYGMQ